MPLFLSAVVDQRDEGDRRSSRAAHRRPAVRGGLSACLWWDAKLVGRVGGPDLRLLLASYAGFCVSMPTLVYLYSGVCLFIPLAALGQPGLSTSPTRRRGFALALGLTMLPVRSLELTLGTGWAGTFNLLPILGTFLLMVEALGLRLDLRRQSASIGVNRRQSASSEADDVSTPPRTEAVARAG